MQLHRTDGSPSALFLLICVCLLVLFTTPVVDASPQSTDASSTPSGQSCVVNCPAKLEPCNCGENEVCVLVKRTCGQCAKNTCQPGRASASQATKGDSQNGSSSSSSSSQVSWVLIGVCGAGVVALLAGGLFIYNRRRRHPSSSAAQGDKGAPGALESSPNHVLEKASMESSRDFIPPGVPWVRSLGNQDRSSVASSVATGWGEFESNNERSTLMMARASTGLYSPPADRGFRRETSFDDSNNATDALAQFTKQELLLPAPAVLADESLMESFKDPSFVEDNRPILPAIPSVDSFARLSFSSGSFPMPNIPPPRTSPPKQSSPLANNRHSKSVDIKRTSTSQHSATRSIGAFTVMSPIEAPRFPPPRMPPPRVPSTTSSIYVMDDDAVAKARNSHGVDLAEYKFPRLPITAHAAASGTAGQRDSVASTSSASSAGSVAQVNIARVEPLRARTTIVQQRPVVGSIHDMQAERNTRMLNGDDARDRLSAVGSASFHRVAASMGGSSTAATQHSKSQSMLFHTEQAYRKLVSQGIVDQEQHRKSEREKRRSSMMREAMTRASVEFVVRDGSLVRKSDEL